MPKKMIKDGVSYSFIKTPAFKTTHISVGFCIPLSQNAAANALAASLMKTGTKKFPKLYSLNRKLASLYGASASMWISKIGDAQELRIGITVNDDRFSNNEPIIKEASWLLCDMIFSRFEDGSDYPDDAFDREKRLLSERIKASLNDKRTYARSRCEEIMCSSEPYGLSPYGTLETVEALTKAEIKTAIERLIKTSFISIVVIGNEEPCEFLTEFENRISASGRNFNPMPENLVKSADTLKECDEKMLVNQGKLVIGLRAKEGGNDRDTVAAWVMNNIFGSSPHSKLFCNVREKMSLCYYCSSRIIRPKGLIFIESGVEQGNIQKAKQAILDEFQKMKDADFTYEEINFAKLSLIDSIKSVNSDQLAIAHWFATRSLDEAGMTPDEACNAIESVTKEDIVNAASGFILDTVYRLLPDGTVTED